MHTMEGILSFTTHGCLTADSDMVLWGRFTNKREGKFISWVKISIKQLQLKPMDSNKHQSFKLSI